MSNDANSDKKVRLTVVVNGTPTELDENINAPLHAVVPKALQQTGNQGQDPSRWDIKDKQGNILDGTRKIETYGFIDGTQLFLSLKAGIGGYAIG